MGVTSVIISRSDGGEKSGLPSGSFPSFSSTRIQLGHVGRRRADATGRIRVVAVEGADRPDLAVHRGVRRRGVAVGGQRRECRTWVDVIPTRRRIRS